jgi:hypothetical protein
MPPLAPLVSLVHGSGGTIVVVSRNFVDTLEALISPSSAFRSVVSSCIMSLRSKRSIDKPLAASRLANSLKWAWGRSLKGLQIWGCDVMNDGSGRGDDDPNATEFVCTRVVRSSAVVNR